jgi:hypothetical protein
VEKSNPVSSFDQNAVKFVDVEESWFTGETAGVIGLAVCQRSRLSQQGREAVCFNRM